MPALIRPGTVTVLTQDGEVRVAITLELNINLNNDGVTSCSSPIAEIKKEQPLNENPEWEIPDFTSTKINFGK